METKSNAYAVLRLCEEDPNYSNERLETDICGHIAQHMGRPLHSEDGRFNWPLFVNHIGMAECEWELWHLLCDEWLPKDKALKAFAAMILRVHGPDEVAGVPEVLRLL